MIDLLLLPAASYMVNGRLSNTPPVRYERMDGRGEFLSRYPVQAKALDFYVRSLKECACESPCECVRSLIISGPEGTGKTGAAIGLVRQIKEQGGSAIYLTAQELRMSMLREGGARAVDTVQMLCHYELLILDEVGEECFMADSDVSASLLYQVVNARYAQCLPTCLVTNKRLSDLPSAFGVNQRIMDRMKGEVIEFGWGG